MAEPTTLSEFGALLGSDRPLTEAIVAYAAALTALHEAERMLEASVDLTDEAIKQRDSALARVAELESKNEIHCPGCSFFDSALPPERDALAAELSELRAAVTKSLAHTHLGEGTPVCDLCEIRLELRHVLAAQPQGEREAQILKRRDWLLGRLMAMNTVRLSQGLLSGEFLRLWELTLNEIAAIDGAQP